MDRNNCRTEWKTYLDKSLSARRAWIEIRRLITLLKVFSVALRKESVDRNLKHAANRASRGASLSARRAWIEIIDMSDAWHRFTVALRKESVDRNTNIMDSSRAANWSLSARRAWIEIIIRHTEKKSTRRRSPQGERG